MAQCRAMGRNAVSVVFLTFLLFYIAYFTSELYTRLNNIRKLERLNAYERELTELTQLLQQYKSEAYTVGQSVALLEEVITKMAASSRRQRHKSPPRDGGNHARQDDIERQLRILDKPLPYLSDGVRLGEAEQSNQRSQRGEAGDEHRLRNSDPSGGGEGGYVVGDRMDANYNSENLQTKQFIGRNSNKYESLVVDKLDNNKGHGSMRQNSVR